MQLEVRKNGKVRGALDLGGGFVLDIQGKAHSSFESERKPAMITMTSFGRSGTPTAGWQYSYLGYIVRTWPNAINELQSFVGTVVRDVPHGPDNLAGYVASFISVRRR